MRFHKLLLFLLTLLLAGSIARAQEPAHNVTLYFFWGNGCPHCAQEEKFLNKIEREYPTLSIKRFEIWGSGKNREILHKVGQKLGANVKGVPFTVVGTNYIDGYYTDDTTGAEIRDLITYCIQNECSDAVSEFTSAPIQKKPEPPKTDPWQNAPKSLPKQVTLPIIGNVDLTTLSLPAVAAVIGTLDGFNPCAMWVLLFLISLLLNLENKKRRWILGLTFLTTSALVYFLFMAAWLNMLLFLGFIVWVRVTIALFALAAGIFNLRKFWLHQTGCVVENNEKRQKTFTKLKQITADKRFITAVAGIIALAFAVNLVELLCSAGFPAIFTQILALNQLPLIQYYLYIALYILFFMLDDVVIFFIAMKTLETTGISTKYAKYSHLIGGILMMLIGALLILKPQYLMFSF